MVPVTHSVSLVFIRVDCVQIAVRNQATFMFVSSFGRRLRSCIEGSVWHDYGHSHEPFLRVQSPFVYFLGSFQIGCNDGTRSRDHHEGEALLSGVPRFLRPREEVQCAVRTVRAAAVEAEALRLRTQEHS